MLLLGYFEGLESERAMAWRAVDFLSLPQFLDIARHEGPPDHSTVSRTRRRIDIETHEGDDAVGERGAAEHRAPGHS